ncbi:MAG: DUF2505 domain-containing protein [Polyangiaceae bacterium]|nr:DUF2505 domain-containing protein [Polyangiaceae bacterium]
MKKVRFEHVFECDVDAYWDKIFFNDEFNSKFFRETLKFNEWRATTTSDTNAVLKRTVTVRPPVGDVPAAVKKMMGDNFGYKEHGTFDRNAKRYHVDVESNVATDKTKIQGDVWVEKAGDHKCRRIAEFTIEVKIMVVGKLVEDIIAKDMTRDFERGAEFTQRWLRENRV